MCFAKWHICCTECSKLFNSTVAYIVGMSHFGCHSVMEWNIHVRFLQRHVSSAWVAIRWCITCLQLIPNCLCKKHVFLYRLCMEDIEHKRVAEQIKELVQIRDSYNYILEGLSEIECNAILTFLCSQVISGYKLCMNKLITIKLQYLLAYQQPRHYEFSCTHHRPYFMLSFDMARLKYWILILKYFKN